MGGVFTYHRITESHFHGKVTPAVKSPPEHDNRRLKIKFRVAAEDAATAHSIPSDKKREPQIVTLSLAGVEGIEPSAYGFGDRRSTS